MARCIDADPHSHGNDCNVACIVFLLALVKMIPPPPSSLLLPPSSPYPSSLLLFLTPPFLAGVWSQNCVQFLLSLRRRLESELRAVCVALLAMFCPWALEGNSSLPLPP
eukprot:5550195-Pyramimonas_sp.AAC.1